MKRFYITLILFLFCGISLFSQTDNQHIKFEFFPEKLQVKAGEEVNVLLWMKIDKGWHTYPIHEQMGSTPTEFFVKEEGTFELISKIYAKNPKVKFDSTFESEVEYYKGKANFILVLKALKDIDFSTENYSMSVKVQQCDDETCVDGVFISPILPEVATIPADMINGMREYVVTYDPDYGYPMATFETEEAVSEVVEEKEEAEAVVEDDSKEKKGFWGMILVALFNGLVAIFMPCVFPMIPITVSFFLKRSEDGGNGMRDAIVYAFSIVATFTIFGGIIAVAMKVFNVDLLSVVSTPVFNIIIVGIFIFFGLSLFGAYEIQAPAGLTNKLDAKSRNSKGILSVVLMAIVFALASFSCTGPFISAALVTAIEQGSWVSPLISMACFSAVLASPFFFLALSPGLLNKTKAGAWMNNIKIVMGFIVIAFSTKYLTVALVGWGIEIPRNLIMAIYASCGLIVTLYVLGVWRSKHDAPVDSLGYPRILFALAFALLTFYFVSGFGGQSMGFFEGMLPARSATSMTVAGTLSSSIDWGHNYEEALVKAKEEGKNVFVDFTGVSCTNCKKMEGDIFPRPAVIEGIKQYVAIKLYTDKRGDEYKANKELRNNTFHSYANPLYVIVTPEGEEIARINYSSEEDFLDFLTKGTK